MNGRRVAPIGENLHPGFRRVHVDMAGPAVLDERATGFGVALVLGLLEVEGFGA